jgi:CRP-like cAMP-binding protein
MRRLLTVRAVIKCEFYILTERSLDRILQTFTEVAQKMRRSAMHRLKRQKLLIRMAITKQEERRRRIQRRRVQTADAPTGEAGRGSRGYNGGGSGLGQRMGPQEECMSEQAQGAQRRVWLST